MKKLMIGLMALATYATVASCSPKPSTRTVTTRANTTVTTGEGFVQTRTLISEYVETPVTLAKYDKIQKGITFQQAVRILGEPSSKSTWKSTGGEETISYTWTNPGSGGFEFAGLTFQDNNLIRRTQNNLK